MGDVAWFEEGRWPVTNGVEISHHHFEDMRKRIFILRNPTTGRELIDYATNTYNPTTPGGDGSAILYNMGACFVVWHGCGWINKQDITRGQWNTLYTKHSNEPPYEIKQPVRIKVGSTIYKCIKVHKSGAAWDTAEQANWTIDNSIPHNDLGQDYYIPPAWQANTEYWISHWYGDAGYQGSTSYWALAIDYNRYHSIDRHVPSMFAGSEYKSNTNMGLMWSTTWLGYGWQLYPAQTDEIEYHPPVRYKDSNGTYLDIKKQRWTYKDKIGLDASHITIPTLAGAQWCTQVITVPPSNALWQRADPWGYQKAVGGTQYSNGLDIPPECISGDDYNKNPKCNQSYQCQIEMTSDKAGLRYPADSTYIANWESFTGLDWHDQTQNLDELHHYPIISDVLWGQNGSGFEFIKSKTCFDYYWDDEYPFTTVPHEVCLNVSAHPENIPRPVGTWRKWWKYSMGRPAYADGTPKFMRSSEMGAPAGGNCSFNNHVETSSGVQYKIWYPPGTFVSTLPTIADFMTWSYAVAGYASHWNGLAYENQKDIFKVSGDHRSDFKIGSVVYFGTGTALANYVSNYAYVLEVTYDGTYTYVRVNNDIRGFIGQNVKGNNNIAARHDPVQVECDAGGGLHYSYELTKELANEMHDALYHWTWVELYPELESRYASAGITDDGSTVFSSLSAAYSTCVSGGRAYNHNPDYWTADHNYSDYDDMNWNGGLCRSQTYGSGFNGCGNGCGINGSRDNIDESIIRYTINNTLIGGGGGGETASAIRCTNPELFKNFGQIAMKMSWCDSQEACFMPLMQYPQQSQSTGYGISTIVVKKYPDGQPKWHYVWVALPVSGSWVTFFPGRFAGPTCVSAGFFDGGPTIDYWCFAGDANINSLSPCGGGIVAGIDYNKVSAFVLDRIGLLDRDNWGYIERDIEPVIDDTRPPLPDPAEWRVEPYVEFAHISQDGSAVGTFSVADLTANSINISGITLADGDLVEVSTTGILPAPLAAHKIYVLKIISGVKYLYLRRYGVDTIVDLTSNGSGTLNIWKVSDYFTLSIKAELRACEDLQGSVPVHYRAVSTGGGCADTVFDESRFISFIDRYLTMWDAYAGGIRLYGTSTIIDDGDGTYSAILPCADNPIGYVAVGSSVHIVCSQIFDAGSNYTVTARTATTVTIDVGSANYLIDVLDPEKNRLYLAADNGYCLAQWDDEDAYSYKFKPQSRDEAVPNNLTGLIYAKECGIPTPTEWPLQVL